jgi:hypothetical protein
MISHFIKKITKLIFFIKISKLNIFENYKIGKTENISKLKNILDNKKIALVGNSPILLKKKQNIDNFDVVIRINILPFKKHYKYVGKRCDIMMMTSGIEKLVDKNYIKIFFSEKENYMTKYGHGKIYCCPAKYRKQIDKKVKGRPTTGLRSLYLLTKIIKNPDITLFGFDHTPKSWYANEVNAHISHSKHNFLEEKKIFLSLCKKYKKIRYSK